MINIFFYRYDECEKEYLELRDGAAQFSRLISRICEIKQFSHIETTENFLYIKYFTDLSFPSNGFKLNVTIGIYFYSLFEYKL